MLLRLSSLAVTILGLALLAACASRPEAGALTIVDKPAAGARAHSILIATTRKRDERPGTLYDGERSSMLDYALATVSVPPTHVNGQIEWPSQAPGDPAREFVTREARYLDGKAGFLATVKSELAKRPAGKRDVVLFVHGYNTLFAEGLYRFTELTHDAGGEAVPVLFTWASRGAITDYIYDLNSATEARDGLEETLRALAASGAEHVNIVAHSMGNWLTVETLRQIRISGHDPVEAKLGLVALAAPDIDIDVFKSQMRRYGKPKKPFIVLISQDDRALAISTRIAGGKQRVGDYTNDKELADLGTVVVNLSGIESNDSVNHWKFVQLDKFGPELRATLQQAGISLPAETRETSGNAIEKIGSSLGTLVSSATNVVVTLPNALVGR